MFAPLFCSQIDLYDLPINLSILKWENLMKFIIGGMFEFIVMNFCPKKSIFFFWSEPQEEYWYELFISIYIETSRSRC